MRIILFSSSNSDDVLQDALILRETRGFDVVTFPDLAEATYHYNRGQRCSPTEQWRNLVCELLENAAVVIHPDTDPGDVADVVHHTTRMGNRCMRLSEVPAFSSASAEEFDAACCDKDILSIRKIWERPDVPFEVMNVVHVGRPTMPSRWPSVLKLIRRASLKALRRRQPTPVPYREFRGTTITG